MRFSVSTYLVQGDTQYEDAGVTIGCNKSKVSNNYLLNRLRQFQANKNSGRTKKNEIQSASSKYQENK